MSTGLEDGWVSNGFLQSNKYKLTNKQQDYPVLINWQSKLSWINYTDANGQVEFSNVRIFDISKQNIKIQYLAYTGDDEIIKAWAFQS